MTEGVGKVCWILAAAVAAGGVGAGAAGGGVLVEQSNVNSISVFLFVRIVHCSSKALPATEELSTRKLLAQYWQDVV